MIRTLCKTNSHLGKASYKDVKRKNLSTPGRIWTYWEVTGNAPATFQHARTFIHSESRGKKGRQVPQFLHPQVNRTQPLCISKLNSRHHLPSWLTPGEHVAQEVFFLSNPQRQGVDNFRRTKGLLSSFFPNWAQKTCRILSLISCLVRIKQENKQFWMGSNNVFLVIYFKDLLIKVIRNVSTRRICMACGTFGRIWRQCWLSLLGRGYLGQLGQQDRDLQTMFERTTGQVKTAS